MIFIKYTYNISISIKFINIIIYMEIINNILNQISIIGWIQINLLFFSIWMDKFIHILMILFLWIIFYYLFNIKNKITLIIILLLFSFWKEFYDLFIRTTFFSWNDIIADIIWIISVFIIIKYKKIK